MAARWAFSFKPLLSGTSVLSSLCIMTPITGIVPCRAGFQLKYASFSFDNLVEADCIYVKEIHTCLFEFLR
jgi:hypothetical protein